MATDDSSTETTDQPSDLNTDARILRLEHELEMAKLRLQEGPFKDATVKKYEISPITITVSDSRESTHVPPSERPCGCGGGGGGGGLPPEVFMDLASKIASAYTSSAPSPGPTVAPYPMPPVADDPKVD